MKKRKRLNRKKIPVSGLLILVFVILVISLVLLKNNYKKKADVTDYSVRENWVYYDEGEGEADVFFVCPMVDLGEDGNYNMSLTDEETKENFVGASNMELAIYDENAVIYEPYYRQVTYPAYFLPEEESEEYFALAYSDVKAAFETYLENCDSTRPLILAGFSQGGDMLIRLMKDFGNDPKITDRLVAVYALGWRLTKEEVEEYPWLKPATGEADTGSIIVFTSEAEDITDSMFVSEGSWSYSINPLNWKTDSTPATKEENLGACFTDYSGNITSEIKELTGAYIDAERGTLKCPDINAEDYSGSLFPDGVYHLYDYQFFYRNLQENVAVRLEAYKKQKGE